MRHVSPVSLAVTYRLGEDKNFYIRCNRENGEIDESTSINGHSLTSEIMRIRSAAWAGRQGISRSRFIGCDSSVACKDAAVPSRPLLTSSFLPYVSLCSTIMFSFAFYDAVLSTLMFC